MRLHGLDAEVRLVDRLLAAAEHGSSSILLVEGCTGHGKSTLLINAAMAALERGFEVASSVDRLALSFANRLLAELPSTFHALPVLGDGPGLPHLRGWLTAQQEADHQGSGTPLLITLDDLHELPPVSAKALATLPTRYASNPVVWLLARSVGLGGAEVQRLFSADSAYVARVRLGAMTSIDTAALVRDIAQAEPAPELLALARLAGGNRLLVVELVRGLIEEHGHAVAQDRARLADLRLPQRLRNAVDLLLCPVSSRCRNMLRLIALSGQLPLSHIAALLQEPIGALVSLIREAVDVGVLAGDVDDLVFVHELTRRTLATEIPSVVARQLAAEAIFAGQSNCPMRSDEFKDWHHDDDVAIVPMPRRASQENGRRQSSSYRLRRVDRSHPRLTETQRAIAHLVSAGLTNQQIAGRLCLSPHTVNYHLRKIYRRLAIHSRAELATLEASSEVER